MVFFKEIIILLIYLLCNSQTCHSHISQSFLSTYFIVNIILPQNLHSVGRIFLFFFVKSFSYSLPSSSLLCFCNCCYLPKICDKLNLLECGHCGPNKLELSVAVDSGMIPAACLLIFKRKHIISRVEAGLLRKINKSLTALIKLTDLVRVSSMLLTDHQRVHV